MNSVLIPRVRFAFKLTFAILGALVLGFYLQLETPRWSAMTAAIVTSGPALAAGGEKTAAVFLAALVGIQAVLNFGTRYAATA